MKPLRILHVLGAMNRGGVETWLMHVLRHADRQSFQTDFLVHTDEVAAYDSEVLALGSRIMRCPNPGNPLAYARRFLQLIRHNGPFDILHCHVHHFGGFVLALGRIAGIPVRIAHSHNDTAAAESTATFSRKAYLGVMLWLIRNNCTHGFAVSQPAAGDLFGQEWRQNRRVSVLYCGIDLAPFRISCDPVAVRAEFGLSENDVIFGHVGRFFPAKNHLFLLDVATCILKHEPRAKFLLVGDGPLRPSIEERAGMLGLTNRIVFAGLRPDIPRVMMGGMDAFLMPSIHEGIPLVLMEAQAAGLPCVVSDVLTEEAIVNPTLVQRVRLSAGVHEWARAASEAALQPRFDRLGALEIVDASRFSIKQSIQKMCNIYLEHSLATRTRRSAISKLATKKRS